MAKQLLITQNLSSIISSESTLKPSLGYLCSHLGRSGIILQFQSSTIYAYIVVLILLVAFAQWLMVKALSTVS